MGRFTTRFYTVEKESDDGPTLRQALAHIYGRPHAERERQLTADFVVRLERFELFEDDREFDGEFIRVRDDDFPFEVNADGVGALQTEGPIGSGVAFRFRERDHTLAIQYDTRIVSPGRAMQYLKSFNVGFGFIANPKMDMENWRKFNDGNVRKLTVAVANPQNLADLEDDAAAVHDTFTGLAEAYGAPSIKIEVGMGHHRGALRGAAREAARSIWRLIGQGEDVRSLRARVKPNDGTPAEDINLIDEVLTGRQEVQLPANDPERNYEIRRQLIRQTLEAHR